MARHRFPEAFSIYLTQPHRVRLNLTLPRCICTQRGFLGGCHFSCQSCHFHVEAKRHQAQSCWPPSASIQFCRRASCTPPDLTQMCRATQRHQLSQPLPFVAVAHHTSTASTRPRSASALSPIFSLLLHLATPDSAGVQPVAGESLHRLHRRRLMRTWTAFMEGGFHVLSLADPARAMLVVVRFSRIWGLPRETWQR